MGVIRETLVSASRPGFGMKGQAREELQAGRSRGRSRCEWVSGGLAAPGSRVHLKSPDKRRGEPPVETDEPHVPVVPTAHYRPWVGP